MNGEAEKKRHRPGRILIIAGDPSGDKHTARIIPALLREMPGAEIVALGGREMEAAGARLIYNLVDHAVVGFTEVISHLPGVAGALWIAYTAGRQADLVLFVDYPGFNLSIARALARARPPKPKLLWYISPQVWAWHKSRIPVMEKIIDRIAVVFPFEQDLFRNAEFVGHPLLELPRPEPLPDLAEKNVVALLPGSREKEIRRHLPVMAQCVAGLRKRGYYPVLSMANADFAEHFLSVDCEVYCGDSRRLLASARRAIIKSGTSTLEAALLGVPFVGVYRLSWSSYFIGRRYIQTRWITMPNILAQDGIVPELIQSDCVPSRILDAFDGLRDEEVRGKFDRLRALLAPPSGRQSASARVAEIAAGLIG